MQARVLALLRRGVGQSCAIAVPIYVDTAVDTAIRSPDCRLRPLDGGLSYLAKRGNGVGQGWNIVAKGHQEKKAVIYG